MKELLGSLEHWRAHGKRAAVARVVDVAGSAPRGAGAAMAVSDDGEIVGSVSGGCVEGAVVEACGRALESGQGMLLSFGYSDADGFAVGLTCGGTIELFVEPYLWDRSIVAELSAALDRAMPAALATIVGGRGAGAKLLLRADGAAVGSLGDVRLDAAVARDAVGDLATGTTRVRHYGADGETLGEDLTVFVEPFVPPPDMIIFGAIDFSAALVRIAKVLGFRVTVCDARSAFATRSRFPLADDVVAEWPQAHLAKVGATLTERDAVCVLTHDPKFDVPAIVCALATDVGYIGVMGSRRTHQERAAQLLAAGVRPEELARLHSPIGLDLGARTPEETAISICAEIIAARNGRQQIRPLTHTEGPIHR
ncbi:MAG TPA: XdhC/CoxI family protein [Mycobacteriales bacterium]|nr:XdhC/CoxI family protein [Mycobacteriales bacterium]HVX71131.1 XdhC/CoxI family protein [Mycobacteriales bacterium]